MSVINKFKDFIGISDDDFEDEEDVLRNEIMSNKNEENDTDKNFKQKSINKSKVVNINATAQLQVVLVKPERFEEASGVADHLNKKRTVVLNLESTNKEISRRLVDFLSGVAYANNGQIKRVANCTFIITPYNVGLMGDLIDELENTGVSFNF